MSDVQVSRALVENVAQLLLWLSDHGGGEGRQPDCDSRCPSCDAAQYRAQLLAAAQP